MKKPTGIQKIGVLTGARHMELEYQWIAPEREQSPLLIFLHEGLGSIAMWRDFPQQLCEATHTRGLVYSRYGYGGSTPKAPNEKWPVSYMHGEARDALPALLAALGLQDERPILYGHSDGGSIALLFAAMYPDRPQAIIVAAPHIFVEDVSITSIQAAKQAYLTTDLPQRLGKFHQNVDASFWGWNDVWLDPDFRAWNIESHLPAIRCPVLAIQGEDDEYGTLAQIQGIARLVPQTQLCTLGNCHHSPHKDQTTAVIERVKAFLHDRIFTPDMTQFDAMP